MAIAEILLPLTTPETEWVRGRPLRKITRPTVAVEVLSPDDDARDVDSKIDVYLRGGSALIIIDPATKTIALHDAASPALLRAHDVLRHSVLGGFELPVGAFFADALDRA